MTTATQETITRLSRDLRKASETLSTQEARYLVDSYYQMQGQRIRADNQARAMAEEPHAVVAWLGDQNRILEQQLKGALDRYAKNHTVGQWLLSITGIGPVLAAGLLAHIDIHRAPTAGSIWRYAGLDPTQVWGKGQVRPWNAELKKLCWKVGESFVKMKGRAGDVYGAEYQRRKDDLVRRNEAGEFAETAASILEAKNIGRTTDAYAHYSVGKLPPGHVHARAKRHTVKLFLSHTHEVMWRDTFGVPAPKPYILAYGEHEHYTGPPGWPMGSHSA